MNDEILLMSNRETGVATLTLNRPEKLNAINEEAHRLLRRYLDLVEADPAIGCVVIRGNGRAFSAGGDVSTMKGAASERTVDERVGTLRRRGEAFRLLRNSSKVTIAEVNGVAAGIGFVLAACCDFRFAGRSARFTTSFANVGLSGDMGGTHILAQLLGPARALQLFLTAELVDADRALQWGLVSEVVADEELANQVQVFAARMAAGPRLAHRAIKLNFRDEETAGLAEMQDIEAGRQIALALTDDHREAVRAFQEKRQPRFIGS